MAAVATKAKDFRRKLLFIVLSPKKGATSAAKAAERSEAAIAALKALRHPKAL